jgi:hypothetical protein
VGLERGPLSLVRIIAELLEWKSSDSDLQLSFGVYFKVLDNMLHVVKYLVAFKHFFGITVMYTTRITSVTKHHATEAYVEGGGKAPALNVRIKWR